MKYENTYGSGSDGLDSKKHRLIEKYAVANKLHRMYLERELNRSGVFRSQHQMLMYISRFPNASQKDIAEHQHVSTATIAVSLKKLEKGGYIKRAMDEADNRFNQICITPKGKEIVDESVKVFQKVEQSIFDAFTEEELSRFEDFLDRVRLNLEHLFQESDAKKQCSAVEKSDTITDITTDKTTDRVTKFHTGRSGGDE